MKIVKRETYLKKIRPFIGQPLAKVITGIRRSGKSTMFLQIIGELKERGVPEEDILSFNMENLDYAHMLEAVPFYKHLKSLVGDRRECYVFIDEIQKVHGWERVVNSLLQMGNVDLYVSGSDSNLLRSDFATSITGRYVSFEIQTLSLSEFFEFKKKFASYQGDAHGLYGEYLRKGGFPASAITDQGIAYAELVANDTLDSLLLNDVVARHEIRDVERFKLLARFIFDNVGNKFSARKISNDLSSSGIEMTLQTVLKYIEYMEESYLIRKVREYDIRGRRHLRSENKYYVSDVSMIYAMNGYKDSMLPGIEENVVYLELLKRGYSVSFGRTKSGNEVDFVAERGGDKIYVQVTHAMRTEKTREREFRALLDIPDNFPKYLVVGMDMWPSNEEGIIQMSIPDFLLSGEY